jgi:TIR domain
MSGASVSPGGGRTTGPGGETAQKVFISYRREDTAPYAGRLYDAMVARFGERNVFMDVDMAPGVDFVERITRVVSGCVVLIVVMGPSWATVSGEDGAPRLAEPDDFVRLEVETALRRPDVTPIPVLVSGARMPKPEQLPAELQALARRNALELSDGRWSYDIGRLVETLDGLLGGDETVAAEFSTQEQEVAPPPDWRLLLEGMLLAGLVAYAARRWLGGLIEGQEEETHLHQLVILLVRRTETWALTGAALAGWLALRLRRPQWFALGLLGLLVGAIAGATGGVIWGVPSLLPHPQASPEAKDWIQVASIAVTGGLLGGLLGSIWAPPRVGAALAGGLAGGVLTQLVFIAASWHPLPGDEVQFAQQFAISAIAVAGLALALLLAVDRRKNTVFAQGSRNAADFQGG